jgi:hypothetical protein
MKSWPCTAVLVFTVIFFQASAQDKTITLRGEIKDSQTQRAIPFANLQMKSGSPGVSSNTHGAFIFKLPEEAMSDTVIISCIGYQTLHITVAKLRSIESIELSPAIIELQEVSVNAQSGLDILKEALARIPQNYDTSATQLTAFYRENVWLGDFQIAYTEAVLDVYHPFKTKEGLNDQIRVLKGRKKKIDYGKEWQLYAWISGAANGARGTLSEDLVKYRNAKFNPFNPGNFRYYTYEHVESIKDSTRNIIVVDILPRNNARKALLRMKVYLDEESLAIIKCNFELSERGLQFTSRKDKGFAYAIMRNVVHATIEYHKFQYSISYAERNGKWYLNSVSRRWQSHIDSKKRKWENRLWRLDIDLVITNVDTENARPISEGDIGTTETSMHSLVGEDFDEAFWENYNVLKTEGGDSAITQQLPLAPADTTRAKAKHFSNRQNGFTRADTLRGKLTPLRTCYDVTFYHLDIALDMVSRSVSGKNLIRFKVEKNFSRMQIDLYDNMKIDRIMFKGKPLTYTREYNAVFIDFPETLEVSTRAEIQIFYAGKLKIPDFSIPMDGGVLWDKDSLGNGWVQMVCQGSGASLWWPNKDHQSDEPDSMRIWITVPAEYTEISNGRLERKTILPENKTRYEWFVSYPINNYNVTFNVGKYAHFTDQYASSDTLTIDYYVMPYNIEKAKRLFTQVKPMLRIFEDHFGPYPFPRDGFTLVESLYPMEHQSGVCFGKIGPQASFEANALLWHESAHEWWGNSITCKDVADMWVHEAFATYAELIVADSLVGEEAVTGLINDQFGAIIGAEPLTGVYDVNHIHYDIGDMYSKGSLILHTFRTALNNDKLWKDLLRAIQVRFRHQTISAAELISFINDFTKKDLTSFFDQYLHHKEFPSLLLKLKQEGRNLTVGYRWKTEVKNFNMPVRVTKKPGVFGFIEPSSEVWKTISLKEFSEAEFNVDDENFLIDIVIE